MNLNLKFIRFPEVGSRIGKIVSMILRIRHDWITEQLQQTHRGTVTV